MTLEEEQWLSWYRNWFDTLDPQPFMGELNVGL